MEHASLESQNEIYRKRTKAFAVRVIHLVEQFPKTPAGFVLGKQLLRSATSVAANYRAMCLARSANERYAKLCIVVEETDETLFWLELLAESETFSSYHHTLAELGKEAFELTKLFTTYRSKLKTPNHKS